jgi:hypothetical protein
MKRKILALAAAVALGTAMTTGAMAAHPASVGGGHPMSMGGGHPMSMGGGHPMSMTPRTGTFAATPQANLAGPRTAVTRPGFTNNRVVGSQATSTWANHTWARGNWGHHRRHFFIGGLGGLYAYNGYPYDCYNWPYYGPPYDSCYGYGYGY